jgi:iron complex transport system permease protein
MNLIPSMLTNSEATPTTSQIGTQTILSVALVALLVTAFVVSLTLGSVPISVTDVVTILLGGEASKASASTIILKFRLPKAITATLAGAALSVAGLQMQTLFRNPLAGPFVLGVSSGASLGVALVVLGVGASGASLLAWIGLMGDWGMALAASIGAAATLSMVLLVARRVNNGMTLLILGLMFGYAVSGLVSVLLHFSIAERIQIYITWTFGSFGAVTWRQLSVLIPTILSALLVAYLLAKPLNALLLGESYARSMGLNVGRARIWIVISASILAGVVTAFCGPIAFLGVAVPHLCRSLFNTSEHRVLLPAVSVMGATLAIVADLVAHMPGNSMTLPLNAVMSLIGAPVVIWVILRRRNLRQAFAS